jgi:hypothetical protein
MKIKPNWELIRTFAVITLIWLWIVGGVAFGPVFMLIPVALVLLALCVKTEPSLLDIVYHKTRKDWPLLHTLSDEEVVRQRDIWNDEWYNRRHTSYEDYAWERFYRLDREAKERRVARRLKGRGP